MVAHALSKLTHDIEKTLPFKIKRRGALDATICHLTSDSRCVIPGSLFAAYRGHARDGHDYINHAIQRGASVVLHKKNIASWERNICYIQSPSPQRLLSALASAFYAHPSKELYVIGVTGTDGKSTVSALLYQLLRKLEIRTGLISTVASDTGGGLQNNALHLTTPEAPTLHAALYSMVRADYTHAVIEASSHALSPRTCRVADVAFDTALCTTITSEHLDFHGSRRRYIEDKARLFSALAVRHPNHAATARARFAISGADKRVTAVLARRCAYPIHRYALKEGVSTSLDLCASFQSRSATECQVIMRYPPQGYRSHLRVPWGGDYNTANLMGAMLAASKITATPLSALELCIPFLTLPLGRRCTVCSPPHTPFTVIIDYAHTPDAFRALFSSLRVSLEGRLVVLFGSAGERDTKKRAQLGAQAAHSADIIYLTDEDPRTEPSAAIISDIVRGVRRRWSRDSVGARCRIIPDRAEAIERAVAELKASDLLLLLGKGHETSIAYPEGARSWNELESARRALRAAGYHHR